MAQAYVDLRQSKKTLSDLTRLPFLSYCYGRGSAGTYRTVDAAVRGRLRARGDTWLLWQHFDDPSATGDIQGCKGDHYHLLVHEEHVPVSTSTANYSFLRRLSKKFGFESNISVMRVRNLEAYIKYLSVAPRKLVDCSEDLRESMDHGDFYLPSGQHPAGLHEDAFRRDPPGKKSRPGSRPASVKRPLDVEREDGAKLTKTEETYARLVELVKMSGARDPREFIDWGLSRKDQVLRDEICPKYFCKQNFDRLVAKAIQMIELSHNQSTWRESLSSIEPPSTCNMSIATSYEFLQTFFRTNGLDGQEFALKLEEILDKRSGKVNTIVFKGPSNGGKSRVANSLKYSFRTYADLSQGISNNFWLESALGKRIIQHEEAQFNEENQEDVKKLMEGAIMCVHRKGLTDAYLKRTPYVITANIWPWCRFLEDDHIRAFKNRSYIVRCETDDQLAVYAEGGDLDPRVWLHVLNGTVPEPDKPIPPEPDFDFDSCDEESISALVEEAKRVEAECEDLSQAQAAHEIVVSDREQKLKTFEAEAIVLSDLPHCPYGNKDCPAFVSYDPAVFGDLEHCH